MQLKKEMGKNIQKFRKLNKITQEKLAELVGVEINSISSIETGKYFPSPETIEQIASILGVEPMQLFDRAEPASSPPKKSPPDTKAIRNRLENEVLESIAKAFEEMES